jgi:hypothetical protein
MVRTILLAALLAAFTVPIGLAADGPSDGALSVKRGRGLVVLKLKGTVIGRLNNGRVQVRDFKPFDAVSPRFTGCKRLKHPTIWLSVCEGRQVGFRVVNGRYNINVRGNGISISALGHGPFVIDGTGELGVDDGVMSIDEQPYQSLPDDETLFYLGTPPKSRR